MPTLGLNLDNPKADKKSSELGEVERRERGASWPVWACSFSGTQDSTMQMLIDDFISLDLGSQLPQMFF